jgi:integrase
MRCIRHRQFLVALNHQKIFVVVVRSLKTKIVASSCHYTVVRKWIDHAKDGDFVFPSFRAEGRVPLSASIFVADYLRPAAKKAGAQIEDGQRFGLHNLRHSLSNWLVNTAKVEPKTVQGILRHAKVQTTLDLYTQEGRDETLAAQGEYLAALGVGSSMVQ